jgi:hypothetical protein
MVEGLPSLVLGVLSAVLSCIAVSALTILPYVFWRRRS